MTLPTGWAETTLEEVARFNPKHQADVDRTLAVSFVPMPAVDEYAGAITGASERTLADIWAGFTHFADGDVIFAKITPCMENGKVALASGLLNGMACGSTEFHVMRSTGAVEPSFLWRYLRQRSFRDLAAREMTGAVGQRRVPKPFLERHAFLLPPLAEQRRIVAKLDTLTARLTRARTELDRVTAMAKAMRSATLASAFSGTLTRNFRGGASTEGSLGFPACWAVKRLEEISEIQGGIQVGKARPKAVELVEVPYLRVANVQRGWLKLDEIKTIQVTPAEKVRLLLQAGDILMNEGGDRDKLGRGWVWSAQIDECIHQNHVFRIRLKDRSFPAEFVSHYANENGQQYFLDQGTQTTNLASISKKRVGALPVPLPPTAEADEIVRLVNVAFARADRLEAEAARARVLLDRLEAAILARAFRGELVPQDPADEPASVLLDRIKAERAAAPKAKRGRRLKEAA